MGWKKKKEKYYSFWRVRFAWESFSCENTTSEEKKQASSKKIDVNAHWIFIVLFTVATCRVTLWLKELLLWLKRRIPLCLRQISNNINLLLSPYFFSKLEISTDVVYEIIKCVYNKSDTVFIIISKWEEKRQTLIRS